MTNDEIRTIAREAGMPEDRLDHFVATRPRRIKLTPAIVRAAVVSIMSDPRFATFVPPKAG